MCGPSSLVKKESQCEQDVREQKEKVINLPSRSRVLAENMSQELFLKEGKLFDGYGCVVPVRLKNLDCLETWNKVRGKKILEKKPLLAVMVILRLPVLI